MATSLPTLHDVISDVQKLDPSLDEGHPSFGTAVFMIAAIRGVGQSAAALSKFTGLSRRFLRPRLNNLRAAGIWGHGTFNHGWYLDERGRREFRCDLRTAERGDRDTSVGV
jgi:hypothetical protein